MKLYVWKSQGSDREAFFVMAENEDQARLAVEKKMAEIIKETCPGCTQGFYGWGTDHYKLTVLDELQVMSLGIR